MPASGDEPTHAALKAACRDLQRLKAPESPEALGTLVTTLLGSGVALLCTAGGLMCSRHRCGEESASMNRTEFFRSYTHCDLTFCLLLRQPVVALNRSRACALVIMCMTDTATCPESRTNKAASKGDLGLPRTFSGLPCYSRLS